MKPSEIISDIVRKELQHFTSDEVYLPSKTEWERAIIKYLDEQSERKKEG